MQSLARNHPLIDGNTRLAWVGTRLFLALNDLDEVSRTLQEWRTG